MSPLKSKYEFLRGLFRFPIRPRTGFMGMTKNFFIIGELVDWKIG